MALPLITLSQSESLIQIIDINADTKWQTVQIQISWLLQKPTDLDLHCLQRQSISRLSRTGVNTWDRNWKLGARLYWKLGTRLYWKLVLAYTEPVGRFLPLVYIICCTFLSEQTDVWFSRETSSGDQFGRPVPTLCQRTCFRRDLPLWNVEHGRWWWSV